MFSKEKTVKMVANIWNTRDLKQSYTKIRTIFKSCYLYFHIQFCSVQQWHSLCLSLTSLAYSHIQHHQNRHLQRNILAALSHNELKQILLLCILESTKYIVYVLMCYIDAHVLLCYDDM